jgi:hypothetical protein
VAQLLFGYPKQQLIGQHLKVLIPKNKSLQKYFKKQDRSVIGKPTRMSCVTAYGVVTLIVCLAEYKSGDNYKLLASFRHDFALTEEIDTIVNQNLYSVTRKSVPNLLGDYGSADQIKSKTSPRSLHNIYIGGSYDNNK